MPSSNSVCLHKEEGYWIIIIKQCSRETNGQENKEFKSFKIIAVMKKEKAIPHRNGVL